MEIVVMRIEASLILIGCLALPAASIVAQTRNVDLTVADGAVLKASYHRPASQDQAFRCSTSVVSTQAGACGTVLPQIWSPRDSMS
jgi:hypothetical protein